MGDLDDTAARNSLRQVLFALRRALDVAGTAYLVTEGDALALNAASVGVDVAAFEQEVAAGTPAAFDRASALYRGDLLAGLAVSEAAFDEWLASERERLRELALEALAKLFAHQRDTRETEAAIRTGLKLLALDPLQEPVHRGVMRLYAEAGRRGAALRQYQHCVATLHRELGLEPEPATKAIYQEILRQRAAPHQAAPYAGKAIPSNRVVEQSTLIAHAETALIARSEEVGALSAVLGQLLEGRGQTVAVIGEAGIGKSRLVAELKAEALRRGAAILMGRAVESEQILPFGPWVEALRTAGVATDSSLLDHLDSATYTELARLLPELSPRVEALGTSRSDSRQLFESVAQVLGRLTTQRPLLVVLEDLHWADEMSARLVAFIGRRLGASPLLLVVTAREDEMDEAPILRQSLEDLDRDHSLIRLELQPLSHLDTLALVRALARSGESTIDRIGEHAWAASEGNPFVVVEIVRAQGEGGSLAPPNELGLPDRVRDLVGRRLDRLSDRALGLAGVAAVIGRDFDFTLLVRAAALTEEATAAGIEELVRRRIVQGVGERFDFCHDRIREVAYLRLLAPRRRLLHRQVAQALEASANRADEISRLAYHAVRGELRELAATCSHRAAVHAVAQSAYREAEDWLDQAVEALSHLPRDRRWIETALDVRIEYRNALFATGDHRRILAHLREAEALARDLGDGRRLGRALAFVAFELWTMGELKQALDAGRRAAAIADQCDDLGLRAITTFYLATFHHAAGDYGTSRELALRNIESLSGTLSCELFGLMGPPALYSRRTLAWALAEQGRFGEALDYANEALQAARALGQPYTLAVACLGPGLVHLRRGDPDLALPFLKEGYDLCDAHDLQVWLPVLAVDCGLAQVSTGKVGEGLAIIKRVVERGRGIASRYSSTLVHLAEAYFRGGASAEAGDWARRAHECSLRQGERGHEAWALRLLGEIAAAEAAHSEAERLYREALAIAEELGMRPLAAHCHLGIGLVHRRACRLEPAHAELRVALESYRALGMTSWLSRAQAGQDRQKPSA